MITLRSMLSNGLRFYLIFILIQVLGMDLLPPQKFAVRQWRFGRKRRRSGTEGADSEGNACDDFHCICKKINYCIVFS